ncbi:hypothetical protein Dimus_018546 [Dionaea muscipula]
MVFWSQVLKISTPQGSSSAPLIALNSPESDAASTQRTDATVDASLNANKDVDMEAPQDGKEHECEVVIGEKYRIVTHLRKKDVVKSKVRGVDLEFDNEKLATILGVHGENRICEYIEEVWEESKYTEPLEITRRFANDATIMKAGRVRSVEMKPSRKVYSFYGNEKCDTSIWEERHLKLHGFDIYGSLNGKEVSRYATSDDETHELCDLHEGSRVATMEIGSL